MGARERERNFTGGSIFANQSFTNRPLPALALETLVLQMTNSEHVCIIYLLCIAMRQNVLFDRWIT